MATKPANKTEQAFREKTIEVLSRLDTQLTQLIESGTQERGDRKVIEDRIAAALKEHDASDRENFEALRSAQDSVDRKLNRAAGALVAVNAIIVLVAYFWK